MSCIFCIIVVFSVFPWILVSFPPSVSICSPGISAFCPFLRNKPHKYSNRASDADEDKESSKLSFGFWSNLSLTIIYSHMDLHFSIYMGQYWSSQSLSGTETKRKRFELWKLERFPLHRGPELELEPGPPPPHYLASVSIASAAPHLVVDIVGSTLLLRRFLNVICQFRKGSEGYLFQEVCIYRAARAGKNLQRGKARGWKEKSKGQR